MKQKILYKSTREFLFSFFPEILVSSEKFLQLREKKRKQKPMYVVKTIKKLESLLFEKLSCRFSDYTTFIGQSLSTTPSLFESIEKFSYDNLVQKQTQQCTKNVAHSHTPLCMIPLIMETTNVQPSALSVFYPAAHLHTALLKKHTPKQRLSDYKLQLRERKKLCLLYGGISRKTLLRAYKETQCLQGVHVENMLMYLEQRLDVLLSRSFFMSIMQIRQYIQHKKVVVNGEIVSICSFRLKAGDCVKFHSRAFPEISSHLLQTLQKKLQKRSSRYMLASTLLTHLFECIENKTTHYKPLLQQYFSVHRNFQRSFLGHIACVKIAREKTLSEETRFSTFLKCKSLLYTKQMQPKRMIAMNVHPMKAVHVEISYKLLQVIVLYSPQFVVYPTVLDFESIQRSLKHS